MVQVYRLGKTDPNMRENGLMINVMDKAYLGLHQGTCTKEHGFTIKLMDLVNS